MSQNLLSAAVVIGALRVKLYSCCHVAANVGLLSVIVAFPGHTHMLFSGNSIDPDQLASPETN